MFWQYISFLLGLNLLVIISAAPQGSPLQGSIVDGQPEPYNYNYKVENPQTNTFFGHSESGDPVGRVTGSYYVFLPDGRTMTVEYFVDGESGYVPKISFQQNTPIPNGPRGF